MTVPIPNNKQLILFDGVCNLCNGAVQYVIRHDKNEHFMFAPLQGEAGQKLIRHYNIDTSKTDSIVLYTPGEGLAFKSTAALKIASRLRFPVSFSVVFFIIPTVIRNWVYDYVARNRYKWFGKQASCMVPTAELKARFLD